MTSRTLFILLTVLVVIVAIGLVARSTSFLADIANVAQIAEGVAAIALLVIAADIREATKARHLEGIRYIRDLIGSEEAANQRKWVYQELRTAEWPLLPEDEKRALAVCRDFDHIGFLCRKGLVPVDLVVETYNRNIVDMWNRLQRFVLYWRQQRNDEDYFWEFEWLAGKAEIVKRRLDKKRDGSR